MDITVHEFFIVEESGLHIADLFSLFAVQNIRLRDVLVSRSLQNTLDAVLNLFHADFPVFDFGGIIRRHLEREKIDNILVIFLILGDKCLGDGIRDLGDVKVRRFSVSFHNLVHTKVLRYLLFGVYSAPPSEGE